MWIQILLLAISIIPVFLLLWFFEKQDKGKKEPLKLKWKVFKWGLLAVLFAAFIEVNIEIIIKMISMNFFVYIFLTAFVLAAMTEEALKMWVVKKFVFKDRHFDEVMDGITYTIIASLGFAMMENIFYVLDGGIGVGIIRALMSVPAHAMFSGIMGYYIGKARFMNTPWDGRALLWKGYAIAVLYHGLFNFFLLSESALMFLVFPLLIIMGVHLNQKIKSARFEDKVDKIKPKKVCIRGIIKIFIASIISIIGTISFIGTIILVENGEDGYSDDNILYSGGFALFTFLISFLIVRGKKT